MAGKNESAYRSRIGEDAYIHHYKLILRFCLSAEK